MCAVTEQMTGMTDMNERGIQLTVCVREVIHTGMVCVRMMMGGPVGHVVGTVSGSPCRTVCVPPSSGVVP